jgi:hypothetical protein
MRASWFNSDREKLLVVVMLLMTVVMGFLLRIPSHPLLAYNTLAEARSHRSHHLPAYAILTDIFCGAILVTLPVFCVAFRIAPQGPAAVAFELPELTSALRC